jgi:acyl-CoA thioester hydrolase
VPERYVHTLRVRYNECDAQGNVFNANFLTYFDVTMTELWRDRLGGYEAMLAGGVDMVVGEAAIRYLRPAHFDDVLEIEPVLRRLGDTSLTTGLLVRRDGELLVEGELRHVFVDAETTAKTRIPDAVREALAGLGA